MLVGTNTSVQTCKTHICLNLLIPLIIIISLFAVDFVVINSLPHVIFPRLTDLLVSLSHSR